MGKIYVLLAISMLITTSVIATSDDYTNNKENCHSRWFCNQDLVLDCQNFYRDSGYYTIAIWSYDKNGYKIDKQNNLYRYYEININENLNKVDWKSSSKIKSVLIKERNVTTEFTGDLRGSIDSTNNTHQLIFCGYKYAKRNSNSNAVLSNNISQINILLSENVSEISRVPEFPKLTIGLAVLVATLGLIFVRKS